jgi:iron complex outermembrane receptor protein
MKKLKYGASLMAIAGLVASHAQAQETAPAQPAAKVKRLQAVTVTATKRAESAQSIPVAVTALGQQELESLGVKSFNDYLIQLPA